MEGGVRALLWELSMVRSESALCQSPGKVWAEAVLGCFPPNHASCIFFLPSWNIKTTDFNSQVRMGK